MKEAQDGGGWGCAVSVKLAASASGKSGAMIGYLTPVTSDKSRIKCAANEITRFPW